MNTKLLKMKKITSLLLMIGLIGFTSCSTEPEPIKYGEDSCHFCEMTIVSQAHSAQAVSKKGKQFKYDAIECMVNDIIKNDTEMAVTQVANYSQPGTMIPADHAHFIINDSINSPMGENLAALKQKTGTDEIKDVITWNGLKSRFLGKTPVTLNH